MSDILIRKARLDDTQAIGALFRARVAVWQRLNARGQVEDLPYESLTIYERWLHGGPWMSVETAAIFLSHVLRGAGLALVAVVNDRIAGYAEAYHSAEPDPFGTHLHAAHILVDASHDGLDHALLQALKDHARKLGCQRLTASFSGYDTDAAAFYREHGFQPLLHVGRYNVPAQTGQGFYKATEHFDADARQIAGWHMPVGRVESARQHWETLWPRLWDALDELTARRTHRLRINAAGQDAFVCCQQHLYDPRMADIYCWFPKPLTPQLLTAIRDWAHRESYRTLTFTVPEDTARLLGADAETVPFRQEIYTSAL